MIHSGAEMRFLLAVFVLFLPLFSFAQAPEQDEQLRVAIWADLDPFPGELEGEESVSPVRQNPVSDFEKQYGFSIERAKKISPYLIGAMISGWRYSYTPYDRTRGVSEFWELEEVKPFDPVLNRIEYHEPIVKENRLEVYAYCNRTPAQQAEYRRWTSIVYPHVKGVGTGSVSEGFEGIKKACGEAAKNAVREYWRLYVKNKPKEIEGSLLLIREPRIYINNGQFTVDLDFFMETDRIVHYSIF